MQFILAKNIQECKENNTVYLMLDGWDDWFTYSTLFNIRYIDSNGKNHRLGSVKIGQKGQGRSPELPSSFIRLSEDYFSLGSNENYYENLKRLSPDGKLEEKILKALNDIAFNLDIFEKVRKLDVVQTSLMRDFTVSAVKNQYNRLANGGAWLTRYNFSYIPFPSNDETEEMELEFDVEIDELPPTNIHVLIGKNGVGKTTMLKNMVYSLESDNDKHGRMEMWGTRGFTNIVYVSFSAFDRYFDVEAEEIPYLYIGLTKKDGIKGPDEFAIDFAESLFEISSGNKKRLWEKTLSILESDNTFVELDIKSWSMKKENPRSINDEANTDFEQEGVGAQNKEKIKQRFVQSTVPRFEKLSSGHKVILLTVAKLIELVEEKTLVLMDEPEEHLHPPLVAAFIRALSNLLTYRNGVGIVATHSPVIVQEVPKKCVWILRRSGDELVGERPLIETFGENIGVLTSEIFGYEVTNSGFHSMIQDVVKKKSTYKGALRSFSGELGNEGKSILRSLMYEKEKEEENND